MPGHRSLLFGLVLFLGACAGPRAYGPESPHHAFPDGLRVVLTRPIEIPADHATVRLQDGRVVARFGAHDIQPHCLFELDTVSALPQAVQPETFQVIRIQRREDYFAGLPAMTRLARAGTALDDGAPTQLFFKTEFRLRSPTQPQVRALTCQHNVAFETLQRHLTLAEMRRALGDYFRLEPGGR